MGVSIVTGQTGDLNVTSENMGACNAGIVGRGQYALFGLGVRMTDATTLHVEGGVACLNGRFVWVDGAGADVAIAAGAAGQNRRDLVCIRYSKTGSGESLRESAKLVAVKGAPTSGAAKDPSYNAGSVLDGASTVDMPIARVTLAGIAPTAEPVAASLEPLSDLRDSVSREKLSVTSSNAEVVVDTAWRIGRTVYLAGHFARWEAGYFDAKLSGLPGPCNMRIGLAAARYDNDMWPFWTADIQGSTIRCYMREGTPGTGVHWYWSASYPLV